MSRYHSYLNSAKEILSAYSGEEPFASFSKKYFARYKKYGSKDRKQISHLCYCCFRLGKAEMPLPLEEKMLAGLFFCSDEPNEILSALKPEWNSNTSLSLAGKYSMLNGPAAVEGYPILKVFPWKEELSEGIEHEKFAASFFIQPELFLRLRPGKENVVKQKLTEAGIESKVIKDDCIALSNSAKLDKVIELNREAVVQDYNSQRVGEFLVLDQAGTVRPGVPNRVWDCCAASGGKSIMLYDFNSAIDLTVSDVRESILVNLRKRFSEAGIKKYKSFIADLSVANFKSDRDRVQTSPKESGVFRTNFDLILCDAPCTGSGTWSRTPEQLYCFDKNKIDKYSFLQKQIVSNTIPYLKPGGYFIYITCSVFKKENEEVIEFIKTNFDLDIVRMEILKGYDRKADTMFAALFKKPL